MAPTEQSLHSNISTLEPRREGRLWGSGIPHLNTEVARQIESQVRHRLGGLVRDFRVLIRDEGLVLQGHVSTYYAKQLAQHAVMNGTGHTVVANEIEVF